MAMRSWCRSCLLLSVCGALLAGMDAAASGDTPASDTPASEIPAAFTPHVASFDYVKREVMIPMRDGVKLQTLILIPRDAHRAPILLTRTPYGATERVMKSMSAHLTALIDSTDVADDAVVNGGYIRVMQDVRGKYGSEGDYLMNRPLRGTLNPSAVDHATDTYDTIDWLVKNVSESNGKVGILGISYDGFTSLMALINPHPALRAAVPINAMVDGWMGDDWFHQGAFRQDSPTYFHDQEASRRSDIKWWSDHYDDYDTWLAAGFVVKLIDVYPDEVGREPKLGGYQLMIAADILRGRYRTSFTDPKPIPAGKSQVFRISLPTANHVFLPGHRIMVQVQSSWFPLYDRNPQTYVENIFFAKPADYRRATIKIFSGGRNPSFVELPVVKTAQARP